MPSGPPEFARDALVGELVRRAASSEPSLLVGPPGAGKTTLLRKVAAALRDRGARPVYLDLFGAAATPERFVTAVLRALPAEGSATRLAQALAIREMLEGGRARSLEAVRALFELLSGAHEAGARPLVLLLDEITEIRSLAYFPGLRHADQLLLEALRARRAGTLLATSFPTLARRLWRLPEVEVGLLGALDVAPEVARLAAWIDPEALRRAACGFPRYARVLLEECAPGRDLEAAWCAAMEPGGRLEQLARGTYETLLLRSRGYGACKAALGAVAHEEGLNLTALVARLGRTPGATRDYLHWLVGVDALRMERKRYSYADALLRAFVRLYGDGMLPGDDALRAAFRALVAQAPPEPPPAPARESPAASTEPEASAPEPPVPAPPPPRPRRDPLIEID